VGGIHEAFSVAIGYAMWFGVAAAVVATLIVVFGLPELALSHHVGEARQAAEAGAEGEKPVPVIAFD
jgi:hypothetical protein